MISNPMNNFPKTRTPSGFTLIELLTVIAIIGLLAGLIVGGASLAYNARVKSRVQAERSALESALDRYKKSKGFYPPDGADPSCVQTPLFYELVGTVITNNPANSFFSPLTGEVVTPSNLFTNVSGFINVTTDPSSPAQNFYNGLKNYQHLIVAGTGGTYSILGIQTAGPVELKPAASGSSLTYINPWHYNSSHPTNNQNSYDLWMDVKYGGKTNRISNWSADPQVVSY